MKTSWKIFLVTVFVIMVGALGGIFILEKQHLESNNKSSEDGEVAGATTEDDYRTKLAKYMNENGMVLYGAYWSEDCQKQKDIFDSAAKYLDYVECDQSGTNANPDECISRKIDSYPTWIYRDTVYKGFKTLSELAQIVEF